MTDRMANDEKVIASIQAKAAARGDEPPTFETHAEAIERIAAGTPATGR